MSVKGKAIIFDLDGTLLDTLRNLGEAMNAVLREHGFSVHPIEAYRYFVGEGVEQMVRRTLPEEYRSRDTVGRLVNKMREEYARRWTDNTRAYPGVAEMLDELERRGLPKAVLSNKPHNFTVEMTKKMLGAWSFVAIRGLTPETPRKPDPAAALEIAREMKIPPSEIVLVGDTGVDMQTANAAGMYAAGVLWGFRDAAELLEAGARSLLAAPHELFDLLEGGNTDGA